MAGRRVDAGLSRAAPKTNLPVPIVLALDFDPVWFGIFLTVMIELALITPPIDLNVYFMRSVTPDIALMDIFRGCGPFVFAALLMGC